MKGGTVQGGTAVSGPVHPLTVHSHPTPAELGRRAGAHAAEVLSERLTMPGHARVLLAAAPSQRATLRALAAAPGVDFGRIEFFHMDDYLGLPDDAPQGFANWLDREFLTLLPQAPVFHRMQMSLPAAEATEQYADVLGEQPFDLVLCGLGVNAHLAFNEPGSDFADPQRVRLIEMDEASRRQQVDEGHFPGLAAVPTHALTVTIPRILHAAQLICSVPGAVKRDAVRATLELDPTPEVPGTALKLRPDVHLYLDQEADPR